MKKTKIVASALVLASAAAWFGVALTQNASFGIDAANTTPSFKLNGDKNRLFEFGGSAEGTSSIVSEAGTSIPVEYSGFSTTVETGQWHSISAGGYFGNTEIISGLSSISFSVDASATITVSWSIDGTTFDSSDAETFSAEASTSYVCYFNNESPNFFRFTNSGSSDVGVTSIDILFSCVNQYRTVTWDVEGIKTTEFYAVGETPSYKGTVPTKECTIEGCSYQYRWYPEIGPVTEDITYTAQFDLVINASAFQNSTITEYTVPDGVTSIGDYAFCSCTSLASIIIPSSVTSIGDNAFLGCSSLVSIDIPDSVTSIGSYAFSDCSSLASVSIPSSVDSIGRSAFSDCTSLTSISIPDSVTSIGSYAFRGCTSLKNVIIGKGVSSIGNYAFYECTSLTSITIPSSVTSIGNEAFYKCTSLESIVIPSSVTSIGSETFSCCTSLGSITVEEGNAKYYSEGNCLIEKAYNTLVVGCKGSVIPSSVTSIGTYAFYGSSLASISIPDSVTSIGSGVFLGCKSLTSISIPSSVTSIGYSAFSDCTSLTSISIPSSVTSIGYSAFSGCTSLASFSYAGTVEQWKTISRQSAVPAPVSCQDGYYLADDCRYTFNGIVYIYDAASSSWAASDLADESIKEANIPAELCGAPVTSIGSGVFLGCKSLTSISIPSSVNSIRFGVFSGCTSLASITVDSDNQTYYSEGNCLIERETNTLIAGCKGSIIPSSVTSIGTYAFHVSSLESISIPDSVTSIGSYAFRGCTSLKNVIIGKGVSSIGSGAFRECSSLTSVTIPSSVTSIADGTFYKCTSLTSIEIPSSVTSIGDEAFRGCSSLESIFIPNSVTSIGYLVFCDCTSLTSISIPSSVTSIGSQAFSYCTSLATITVDENNANYHSEGNCLIEKATNTLIAGCKGSVIPSSVTSIGHAAFAGCTSLTSIFIPSSVTSIGSYAFEGCSSLQKVYYGGTSEQWSSISIDSYNSSLTDATRYYFTENGDAETSSGNWWYYSSDGSIIEKVVE